MQFLPYRWDTYSELLILYVLGIGSPSHPIPADTWGTWKLPLVAAGGNSYIGGGPLFIHQYSQAWLDLRNRAGGSPPPLDYYANSVAATRAQREYLMSLSCTIQRIFRRCLGNHRVRQRARLYGLGICVGAPAN